MIDLVLLGISMIGNASVADRGPHSPISMCMRVQYQSNAPVKPGARMQLSYPGTYVAVWGNYRANNEEYSCMHPYDWQGGPHTFELFAWQGLEYYRQCSRMLNTDVGRDNAPQVGYYYTVKFNFNTKAPYCVFDHIGKIK